MIKLVLVRHGQSVWNLENKFTGWTDVELSEQGIKEAKEAGKILKEQGFHFDLAFTSVLKRAENTLDYILKEMGEENIEIKRSWKLNERHYGALQGLNKDETKEKYGEKQVLLWRRSTDVRPPELEETDERYPGNDPKYKDLTKEELVGMQKQKRPNGTIVFELSPDAKQKNMHDDRVDCVAMMCNHLMELRAKEVLELEEKPKTEFKEMFAKQKSANKSNSSNPFNGLGQVNPLSTKYRRGGRFG